MTNVWFWCFVIAVVDMIGWVLVFAQIVRSWFVLLAGIASAFVIALALPWWIVVYLGLPGMLAS